MSEAITKACEACAGIGRPMTFWNGVVEQGCAWLPSNPLAVIEVAARLLAQRHGLTPSIELLGPDGAEGEPDWTCRLVVTSDIQVEAAGSREEIGVLVLREVCRG